MSDNSALNCEIKITDEIKELSKQKTLKDLTEYAKNKKIDLTTHSQVLTLPFTPVAAAMTKAKISPVDK
jgi:hypothetical protein